MMSRERREELRKEASACGLPDDGCADLLALLDTIEEQEQTIEANEYHYDEITAQLNAQVVALGERLALAEKLVRLVEAELGIAPMLGDPRPLLEALLAEWRKEW